MVELRDVRKTFDGNPVLDGVSFSVRRGETFVIIGLSGTGKTVTLRHIAGLTEPDRGDVLIDGVSMNKSRERVREGLRRKMGVVFQSGAILNWLTVRENVALPLVERGRYSRREIDVMVDEKLAILQLSDAADKMPAEISGGMRKRTCLARVLVRNPELILYDEPTSGLDPVMSSVINALIVKLRDEFHVTSIAVTHDMKSAYQIADRIAVLFNGRIIECDVPDKIRESADPIVRQLVRGELEGPIRV